MPDGVNERRREGTPSQSSHPLKAEPRQAGAASDDHGSYRPTRRPVDFAAVPLVAAGIGGEQL